MEVIGLIPAGGIASRLGKIPCSKEILPIHFSDSEDSVTVVSENLIKYYKKAGIQNIYFIIRKGKWDIPEYYGDGSAFGVNIGYLILNLPFGTPFTLDQAYPFVKDKIIALGFPDILFEPQDAYSIVLEKLISGDAEIVLGVFPVENYLKWDMVDFDSDNNVKDIVIKQDRPDLKFGWTIVAWKPAFTRYMNQYLKEFMLSNPNGKKSFTDGTSRELYVGDIIRAAIADKIQVDHVKFEGGNSLDIGTPDDLKNYMKRNL